MNKNTSIILGFVFILTSGIIYTIERLSSYIYWLAQINTGTWQTNPSISFFDNIFTFLFIIIGIILIVIGFKEKF